MLRLALAVLLVASACSGDPSTDSSTTSSSFEIPPDPVEAVEQFLDSIASGEGAPVTDDRQVVLLAGAEGASMSEIADLFTSIGSGRVAANFWRGFAEGLQIEGIDFDDVRLGRVEEFSAGQSERVSVEVWDATRSQMRQWHLAKVNEEWRLDLFATFGDVYAGPLRLLLRSLDPGADGYTAVSGALADQATSLGLAPATEARLAVSADLAELP